MTGVEEGEGRLLRSGDAAVWKLLTFNAEFLPSELLRRGAVWLSTGVLKHDIQHNAAHPSALMGIRLVIVPPPAMLGACGMVQNCQNIAV